MKKIILLLMLCILLAGCLNKNEYSIPHSKTIKGGYRGICGDVCLLENTETFIKIGNRTEWQCICTQDWGKSNVTYHCTDEGCCSNEAGCYTGCEIRIINCNLNAPRCAAMECDRKPGDSLIIFEI